MPIPHICEMFVDTRNMHICIDIYKYIQIIPVALALVFFRPRGQQLVICKFAFCIAYFFGVEHIAADFN